VAQDPIEPFPEADDVFDQRIEFHVWASLRESSFTHEPKDIRGQIGQNSCRFLTAQKQSRGRL
jgi:hypothetical protein